MNTNRGDYPATNRMQLEEMLLEDWHHQTASRLSPNWRTESEGPASPAAPTPGGVTPLL